MINLVATLWALWDEEESRWAFGIIGNERFADLNPIAVGVQANREVYMEMEDKWIAPSDITLPVPDLESIEECFGYYHYHA